jgi:hypothetical protein
MRATITRHMKSPDSRIIRLIALFRLLKAVLLMALRLGALKLLRTDAASTRAEDFLNREYSSLQGVWPPLSLYRGQHQSAACRCSQSPLLTAEPQLASVGCVPLPPVFRTGSRFRTDFRRLYSCVAQTLTPHPIATRLTIVGVRAGGESVDPIAQKSISARRRESLRPCSLPVRPSRSE